MAGGLCELSGSPKPKETILSKKLEDLHPDLLPKARSFLVECELLGVDVMIICTYRSNEEQAEAYAQGRTKPGKIVTWAMPGESKHNFTDPEGKPSAQAFDFVILRNGKITWGAGGNGIDADPTDDDFDDLELWQKAGAVAVALGLEWAGNWPLAKREFPHVQLPS